jgi:hypothetical protein
MTPQAVVQAFYAALNRDRYGAAWSLQTSHFQAVVGPYSSWVAGYGGTANDQLTIAAFLGDEVDISLDATQSDGSQQTYQGVYYVHDGLISGADVAEVSDTPGPWCSVTVDPSYDGWGDIEVNVTSNQPSEPISISTAEEGATDTLTSSTDGSGDAAAVYPATSKWAQGYTVSVTVVAGLSSCGTSFTP